MQLADEKHSLLIGFHLVERLQQSWIRRCNCASKAEQKRDHKTFISFSTLQSVKVSPCKVSLLLALQGLLAASLPPLVHRTVPQHLHSTGNPTSRSICSQLASLVGKEVEQKLSKLATHDKFGKPSSGTSCESAHGLESGF